MTLKYNSYGCVSLYDQTKLTIEVDTSTNGVPQISLLATDEKGSLTLVGLINFHNCETRHLDRYVNFEGPDLPVLADAMTDAMIVREQAIAEAYERDLQEQDVAASRSLK